MIWTNKGKEFDEIAKIICDDSLSYYIWGAGTFGISVYQMFQHKINILGFIDSDINKQGSMTLKDGQTVTVYAPDFLQNIKNVKIIVGNGWLTEVYSALDHMGFKHGVDYFHANDFMAIYMLYKENKVYAISANINVTTKCTLRCEKCMALMPYVKNPRHVDLEEIQDELETYFQWVDHLAILGLGGGDVLLHPKFDEILEWVCEQYLGKKVQDIEIYTNAIIMPKETTLALCKKYNVIVRFSDYSAGIPGRQKIDELIHILNESGIRYDKCVWDTWYDIGFPQKTNGLPNKKALIEHYDKCITKLCAVIYQKRLYFCSVHSAAVVAGYCAANENDSFNLEEYSEERKKEFIEFNAGYCTNGFLTYCQKCNGYQNISNKFVPVAKQLIGDPHEICKLNS